MARLYTKQIFEVFRDEVSLGAIIISAPALRFDDIVEKHFPKADFTLRPLELVDDISVKATDADREAHAEEGE